MNSKAKFQPDVFILGSGCDGREYIHLQTNLLHLGVAFEGLKKGKLPTQMPDDLSKYKVFIYSGRDAYRLADQKTQKMIADFTKNGGHVVEAPYEWEPGAGFVGVHPYMRNMILEDIAENVIAMHVIGTPRIPDQSQEIVDLMSSRPDDEVINEMADNLLGPCTHYYTDWNDSTASYLRSLFYCYQLTNNPKLKERAQQVWNQLILNFNNEVVTTSLYGDKIHPIGILAEMASAGWLELPLQKLLKMVDDFLAKCCRVDGVILGDIKQPTLDVSTDITTWYPPSFCALGKLCGREDIVQEAVNTLLCSEKLLCDPVDGLWVHTKVPAGRISVKWGRGMGWAVLAASRSLPHLPENHPVRKQMLDLLSRQFKALARVQTGFGWWRSILDLPISRMESSCTAFILEGLGEAAANGLYDEELAKSRQAAYKAVKSMVWCGYEYAMCSASLPDTGPAYYMRRPFEMGPPVYVANGLARHILCERDQKKKYSK